MTRNGKIARLLATIRTELNQRILDGEQGKPLVEWLNGLPKVQVVLQAKFDGNAINDASKNPELTRPPEMRTNAVQVSTSESNQ